MNAHNVAVIGVGQTEFKTHHAEKTYRRAGAGRRRAARCRRG